MAAYSSITRVLNGTNKGNIRGRGTEGDRLANRLAERFALTTEAVGSDEVLVQESPTAPSGKFKVDLAEATGKGRILCAHHSAPSGGPIRVAEWMLVRADTSNEAAGDPVYLDASADGKIRPDPNGGPQVGIVLTSDSNGWIILQPGLYDRTELVMSISLTNAQVKTLNATPVEAIAAPGAGKAIYIPEGVQWMLDYDTAAFDAVGSSDFLVLQYSGGANLTASVNPTNFGNATADAGMWVPSVGAILAANTAVDAALLTGEWYSAAGGGALVGLVKYRIVDIALN